MYTDILFNFAFNVNFHQILDYFLMLLFLFSDNSFLSHCKTCHFKINRLLQHVIRFNRIVYTCTKKEKRKQSIYVMLRTQSNTVLCVAFTSLRCHNHNNTGINTVEKSFLLAHSFARLGLFDFCNQFYTFIHFQQS